jgi:hypothetical protein
MESPLLGLVLDSSVVIGAERNRQTVAAFIEAILLRHGPVDLGLSPVSVAELVHGVYRAKTPEASQRRREYIEELVNRAMRCSLGIFFIFKESPVSGFYRSEWALGTIVDAVRRRTSR